MEFLQGNWFSLLLVAAYIGERIITWAKRDAKFDRVIEKMAEADIKMERAIKTIDSHIADPNVHVNAILLKLFDERFDYMKKEQNDTRTDIQRIESLLQNMH
jgi:hypothetical protein